MLAADADLIALYTRWWTTTEGRAEATVTRHRAELDRLADQVAPRSLLDLDRLTIEDWIASRLEVSSHTGRWAFRAARSFFGWAAAREVVAEDPTVRIPGPREARNPTPTTVTEDDFATLLDSIDGDSWLDVRDRAIVSVLWSSGVRRGELARMRVEDITFHENGTGQVLIRITKTRRPRVVPLLPFAVDALAAWLAARETLEPGEVTEVWVSRWRGEMIVLSHNAIRLAIERRAKAAGVKASAHSFRRGATVHLLRNGVSDASIRRAMGWSDSSPMLAAYSRTYGSELALDEVWSKLGNGV